MATIKYFNGRRTILPGVYSTIKSAIQNPPSVADYSKVLIIDTGGGATYGGGSGVNGALANGQDAVYQFTDLVSYRSFLKGGLLWKAAEGLFKPKNNEPGVSVVYHVRAATTTAATLTFSPTGGGSAGGSFVVSPKDEGLIANGSLDTGNDDNLIKGYAFTVDSGVVDTAKFIYKLYVGSYVGTYAGDSVAYDDSEQADSVPILLAQSPEFNNVQELIDWADTDKVFGQYFVKGTCSVTGAGTVTAADATAVAGYNVAVSATETYGDADLTAALEVVKDLDYTFILADVYGTANYDSADVGVIQAHIEGDAKYDKFMYYGGGEDSTEFSATDGSIDQAAYFNSEQVIVVHSNIKKASNKVASGFRVWPSLVHAAYVLGRVAGLPPQVPATNKAIGIDGLSHNPTDKEKVQALEAGVWITYFDADFNDFVNLQDVNSLQNNTDFINSNGTSFSHQIGRIKAQLNKDLTINAKLQLLGQPLGVNRNTLSANAVKKWTEGFLEAKKAKPNNDNLIIRYENVTVTRTEDYYEVTYEFEPNGEINKLFLTGYMID